MIAAYILINSEPGALREAAEKITSIDGVRQIDAITGPFDAIAYAEAGTPDELGSLVVSRIQKVAGVQKTLTCLVVDLAAAKAA